MGAPRRSTPPRSSARGRHKPPVSRERTSRTRTGPQRRARGKGKTAAKTSARTRTAKTGGSGRGRSFLFKMAFMALLGYALVLSVDVLPRLVPDEAGNLWDKLVDRWLDNDVPRTQEDEAPPPKPKKRNAPVAKAPPKPAPAPQAAPPSKPKGPPRADLEAPRPDEYVKESRSLAEEKAARARLNRKKLDSLIDKVTGDL